MLKSNLFGPSLVTVTSCLELTFQSLGTMSLEMMLVPPGPGGESGPNGLTAVIPSPAVIRMRYLPGFSPAALGMLNAPLATVAFPAVSWFSSGSNRTIAPSLINWPLSLTVPETPTRPSCELEQPAAHAAATQRASSPNDFRVGAIAVPKNVGPTCRAER